MPQIKEYRQQTNAPGPANYSMVKGSDFSGGMGNNFESLGNTISQVNDVFAKREKQDQEFQVQKTTMKEQLDLNEYMQQLKLKAPAGAEGFTDQAKVELDKRKNALLDAAPSEFMRKSLDLDITRVHMGALNESMQFEAESKAKQSKLEVSTLLDRTNNAVRMNPATVSTAIEAQNKLIDNTPIDATTKEAWKQKALEDVRRNEIRGWIDVNPYKAKEMIQNGTWDKDLSDEFRNSLLHESNQGIRALEIEKNRSKKLDDDVLDAKREATKDDFISRAATGNLSALEIAKNDTLTAADKEHMLRAVNSHALDINKSSNPAVENDMFERINLPDGDPKKITDDSQIMAKLGGGNLDLAAVKRLRTELQGNNSPEGKQNAVFKKGLDDIAKGMLTKSNGMGFKDPEGDTQLQKWRVYASQALSEGQAKGLSITQMTNPDSKDYIGTHIKSFQRSQDQVMQSMFKSSSSTQAATAPKAVVPARAANESAADYLKRIK